MKTFLSSLHRFWFAEAPAARLGVLRLIVGTFSLAYLLPRVEMFRTMSQQQTDLFEPTGVVGFLEAPLPASAFDALLLLTLLSNFGFLLGWRYRLTGPLFGTLFLVTLCYRNSWSMLFHNDNVLVLHALILGFAPAADAYSLDCWRNRRKPGSWLTGRISGARSWAYGWPTRLLVATTVATYFLSGVAKLAGPTGLGWATGRVLRDQIAVDALRKTVLGATPSDAIQVLYDQSLLFLLIGAGTLVLELGAPLVLAHRRLGWVWAGLAFLMHWGIFFVMGITFRYQLTGALFAPFFPVERLGSTLRRWWGAAPSEAEVDSPVARSV
jgi:hypothetical protein